MGKLRFTLGNIWFWVCMMVMCFLVQNLGHGSANPQSGFDLGSLFIVSLACSICLFMFYFTSHKENKVRFDWVLLPIFIIVGIVLLLGIWIQQTETFVYPDGSGKGTAVISIYDKLRSSVILVIFMSFLYGGMFVVWANVPNPRINKALLQTGIFTAYMSIVASLIIEAPKYKQVFTQNLVLKNVWISSIYGNPNAYAGFLLLGFLSCIIANYHKPRLFLYLSMIVFAMFSVFTTSTAAVLLMGFVLVIYTIEEVTRFAIKKRWYYCIVNLIILFGVLTLVILLFVGSKNNWPIFVSVDKYLTSLIINPKFENFNNRFFMWDCIIRNLTASKKHMIFGYGFLLSVKYLHAMLNYSIYTDFILTIESAHNGYMEILIQTGFFGLFIHFLLSGYFVYCLVRLLLEKRFHYVFVFGLVALTYCLYNMTEACPPFFHGPKELYFTMVLFMPVISRSKYLWHKEYLDDFKKIEAPKRRTDYKTFARGLGIVLTSIIVISIAMLISPMTISTPWLRNLWLIVLVGSLGLQIFLPYLVGLYSKDSSGWMFLLHLSVNLLFIFLIIFAVGFVMISSHASKYVIILVTGITALLLFTGDTFAYILVKHGSIEEWGMTILESLFLIPRYAIIGGFVPTVGLVLAIQAFNRINIFNYFIIAAIGLFGFYAVLYFLPTKRGKEMIVEANLQSISRVQKAIIYDETYYG